MLVVLYVCNEWCVLTLYCSGRLAYQATIAICGYQRLSQPKFEENNNIEIAIVLVRHEINKISQAATMVKLYFYSKADVYCMGTKGE